jgi:hypothetical protein
MEDIAKSELNWIPPRIWPAPHCRGDHPGCDRAELPLKDMVKAKDYDDSKFINVESDEIWWNEYKQPLSGGILPSQANVKSSATVQPGAAEDGHELGTSLGQLFNVGRD